METTFLEHKIKHIEHEFQEVKSMLSNSGKNKKKSGFSSLYGILKGKKEAKYVRKSF
jgi:hypothetical protein